MINTKKSIILIKSKIHIKEVYYDRIYYGVTGADCLCYQRIIRTCCDSLFEKIENGTDREGRRRTIPSEKSRNSYYGRNHLPVINSRNFPVLCKRLSEDHSGSVSDPGIWNHRISGRLSEGRTETFRWPDAYAENGLPDCCNRNIRILSDEVYRYSNDHEDSIFPRT